MITRISLFIFCISVFTFTGFGQTYPGYSDSTGETTGEKKSVTNADLEKFRRHRVKAQKELRENYEQLGFPSPEEMALQNEKSRAETAELSARFGAERLERERVAAQLAAESRSQNALGGVEKSPDFSPEYNRRYYEWYGGEYFPRNPQDYYNFPGMGNGIPTFGWPGSRRGRFPSSRKRGTFWR